MMSSEGKVSSAVQFCFTLNFHKVSIHLTINLEISGRGEGDAIVYVADRYLMIILTADA